MEQFHQLSDLNELQISLENEKIETWFDLGLLLDRLKDAEHLSSPHLFSADDFKQIGVLTQSCHLSGPILGGEKILRGLKQQMGEGVNSSTIPLIAGAFSKEIEMVFGEQHPHVILSGLEDDAMWEDESLLYSTRLSRGSDEYNLLAKKIWAKSLSIVSGLLKVVKDFQLSSLLLIDTHGEPRHLPLALAVVLVSERLSLPVFCYHHSSYHLTGNDPSKKKAGVPDQYQDRYYMNSHLGEVHSFIEGLHPWQGKRWIHFVPTKSMKDHFIYELGINPLYLQDFPLMIDLEKFYSRSTDQIRESRNLLDNVFTTNEIIRSESIFDLSDNVAWERESRPILVGHKAGEYRESFFDHSMIFMVSSAIHSNHYLEDSIAFIQNLLEQRHFRDYIDSHRHIHLCIVISGTNSATQNDYFNHFLSLFKTFLEQLDLDLKNRIFLCCLFGAEGRSNGRLDIADVYSISDLVLSHSLDELHGHVIVESAAMKVPVVAKNPISHDTFKDVLGVDLEKEMRLQVITYEQDEIHKLDYEKIVSLLLNLSKREDLVDYNRKVVEKRFDRHRYNFLFKNVMNRLEHILSSFDDSFLHVTRSLAKHHEITKYDELFKKLVLTEHRRYIPGINFLEFMIYLKSLIDPSFFRVEEMNLRGRIFDFAHRLRELYLSEEDYPSYYNLLIVFYKAIESIFQYHEGEDNIVIDHSISYRHRSRRHYPYRKLTEHELYGIVGDLFRHFFPQSIKMSVTSFPLEHFSDLRSSILFLAKRKTSKLVFDDSDRLVSELLSLKPFAVFPGHYFQHELEVFGANVFKERLGLSLSRPLVQDDLTPEKIAGIGAMSFFVRRLPLNDIGYDQIIEWMENEASSDLSLLWQAGLIRIIPDDNLARGVHLGQLGTQATEELLSIHEKKGFVVATTNSSFMLEMIDLPCFHIGQAKTALLSQFMGIKKDDCYILWVPAGLKSCLSYPTPIQTPADFYQTFHSELYDDCVRCFGEDHVLSVLKEDACLYGNPIRGVLESMLEGEAAHHRYRATTITGVYADGLPWSGALFEVPLNDASVSFSLKLSGDHARPVLDLIDEFEAETSLHISFAWNGGYILNNELVGKLGLPESYIGTPLGLLIEKGKSFSLPLYNKAAFLVDRNGKIRLERVNLFGGFSIVKDGVALIEFNEKQRNISRTQGTDDQLPLFYDLLFSREEEYITSDRMVYRIAGNRIIEKVFSPSDFSVVPVGLIISLPKNAASIGDVGDQLEFILPQYANLIEAVEAGPLLVQDGKHALDMELEGWTHLNSIATQAARLDYTNMRGPKMVAGLRPSGDLVLVAINGRIRESVGASHIDAANILLEQGCEIGMGFDPGGSVTLVVEGKPINISPYNKDYEGNIFCLPPKPRFVGNAILGIIEDSAKTDPSKA